MGIVEKIKTKFETVERLESDLAKLIATGAALCTEIDRLTVLEGELDDVDQLARTIVETRAAKNKLKKVDADILDLRGRLDLARDQARARLLERLAAAHASAASDFFAKATAAQAAVERVVAAREEILNAGFRRAYDTIPVPPLLGGAALLAVDLIENYGKALNPAPFQPAPRAEPTARKPVTERSGQGTVALYEPPAKQPAPRRRPPLRESASDGEQLVQLVRGGVEHPRTGEQLRTGDVIAVKPQLATALANNGAAQPVTPADVAEFDALNPPAAPRPAAADATTPAPETTERESPAGQADLAVAEGTEN